MFDPETAPVYVAPAPTAPKLITFRVTLPVTPYVPLGLERLSPGVRA